MVATSAGVPSDTLRAICRGATKAVRCQPKQFLTCSQGVFVSSQTRRKGFREVTRTYAHMELCMRSICDSDKGPEMCVYLTRLRGVGPL